jgi:hypothetical protein
MNQYIRCLFLLAAFASATAHGAVSGVASSPSSAQADFGRSTPVSVAWIVSGVKAGTISSTKGVFRTDTGDVLGTVEEQLSKSAASPEGTTLTETVLVPSSVVVRAHLMGLTQIRYERSFSDGNGPASGSMSLYIIAGTGVNKTATTGIPGSDRKFDLSHLSISFSDNGLVASVDAGDTTSAKAKARFTANRIVSATWEIAGPNPGKAPTYDTLATVSQMVEPDRDTYFNSPALPTDKAGVYLLRLTITTPAVEFDEPVLRYVVNQKGSVAGLTHLQTSKLNTQ